MTGGYQLKTSRACGLLRIGRSSYYYQGKGLVDGPLREALRVKAAQRRRFGYRRLLVMLRREGWKDNHKRIYRLYCQEGLQVRRRKRKQAGKWRGERAAAPQKMNQRWSMDFVSDTLASGRRFRSFNLVDDFSRECLGIEVDTSLGGQRVVRVLERIAVGRGLPEVLVMDNGPEFTGKALDAWAYERGVKLQFIQPGKPVQNAYVESFNGKFRDECLNENWFINLTDARELIEAWRQDYNSNRPHSSLGNMTPEEYAVSVSGLREATPPSVQKQVEEQVNNVVRMTGGLAQ